MNSNCWKTKPRYSRRRSACRSGRKAYTSIPSIRTRPVVGALIAPMVAKSVLLPEPDGPMTSTYSPLAKVRSTPWSATTSAPDPCPVLLPTDFKLTRDTIDPPYRLDFFKRQYRIHLHCFPDRIDGRRQSHQKRESHSPSQYLGREHRSQGQVSREAGGQERPHRTEGHPQEGGDSAEHEDLCEDQPGYVLLPISHGPENPDLSTALSHSSEQSNPHHQSGHNNHQPGHRKTELPHQGVGHPGELRALLHRGGPGPGDSFLNVCNQPFNIGALRSRYFNQVHLPLPARHGCQPHPIHNDQIVLLVTRLSQNSRNPERLVFNGKCLPYIRTQLIPHIYPQQNSILFRWSARSSRKRTLPLPPDLHPSGRLKLCSRSKEGSLPYFHRLQENRDESRETPFFLHLPQDSQSVLLKDLYLATAGIPHR